MQSDIIYHDDETQKKNYLFVAYSLLKYVIINKQLRRGIKKKK